MGKSRISNARSRGSACLALARAVGLAFDCACNPVRGPEPQFHREVTRTVSGVVWDVSPAFPLATEHSHTRGVIALYAARTNRDIEELVHAYLRAVDAGDEASLARLVAKDATMLGRPASSRAPLIDVWRERARGDGLRRPVEHWSIRDARAFDELKPSGVPPRPPEMRQGDVLVSVRITRLLDYEEGAAEVLVFLLRREVGQLKIAAELESREN